MKINLIILCVILALSGTYTYITVNKDTPLFNATSTPSLDQRHSAEAHSVPNFTYTRLNGTTGQLYNHKGRTTLIHFWASWCAPCLVELPELIDLAEKQENIDILAISSDQNPQKIERFINKTGKDIPANFILISDPQKDITQDRFQTIKLPETFILSPSMVIAEKIIGAYDEWTGPAMIEKLNTLSSQ